MLDDWRWIMDTVVLNGQNLKLLWQFMEVSSLFWVMAQSFPIPALSPSGIFVVSCRLILNKLPSTRLTDYHLSIFMADCGYLEWFIASFASCNLTFVLVYPWLTAVILWSSMLAGTLKVFFCHSWPVWGDDKVWPLQAKTLVAVHCIALGSFVRRGWPTTYLHFFYCYVGRL